MSNPEKNNTFEKINEGIRSAESSIVNLISAIAPWLAPISPAYMTYQHAIDTLQFPKWVAVPVAVVVEILGFSAISTLMAFWFFNRANKALSKKAPTGWVLFAFAFYLALIVSSNVILDASGNSENAIIVVKALYTLQTIPAALIVIARAGHKDLLSELKKEKEESRRKVSESDSESSGKFPVNWRQVRKTLTEEQVKNIAIDQTKNIAFHFKIDERTARNWRKYAQEEIKKVQA